MDPRRIQHLSLLSLLLLAILPASRPLRAQEPAAPDDPVARALAEIEDESRPLLLRSQQIGVLLDGGQPAAQAGLRQMLLSPDRPTDLRLAIAYACLARPGLPLFDDVIAAAEAGDEAFRESVASALYHVCRPELVRGIARRVTAEGTAEARRLLLVRLLGSTRCLAAVEPLVALWESGPEAVATEARAALARILPLPFGSPAAAREFFAAQAGRDLETILRDQLARALDGGKADPAIRSLTELARSLLPQATLANLVEQYLGCQESAEVRRMGAERLRTYPFAEREKENEGEARKRAVVALLDALERERDAKVAVALLGTLRTFVPTAREWGDSRTTELVRARLDDREAEVRLAAVATLGELKDRTAIPELCRRYEAAAPGETAFRLAILDALDKIGDGVSDWVLARLEERPADESLTYRLVQFLKKYPEGKRSLPVLIDLLGTAKKEQIRWEAVDALGSIGVKEGDPQAIRALAEHGLADEVPGVRENAARQLGNAPEVGDEVVDRLRDRLRLPEEAAPVKIASALSLLKLRGPDALPWLADFLKDDAYWIGAFRKYFDVDVIAARKPAVAEQFVEGLFAAGADARCAEAARRVLDAKDLAWEGAAKGGRARVLLRMLTCLERTGKAADALAALATEESTLNLEGDLVYRFALAKGRLLRVTGAFAKADEALAPLLAEGVPAPFGARARLEIARLRLAQGKPADAEAMLEPLLANEEMKAEVEEVRAAIRAARQAAAAPAGREPADLVKDLDSPRAEVRTAAVDALRAAGEKAWPALRAWLDSRPADAIAAAVKTIGAILDRPLAYDPAAPEEARKAALDAVRTALTPPR